MLRVRGGGGFHRRGVLLRLGLGVADVHIDSGEWDGGDVGITSNRQLHRTTTTRRGVLLRRLVVIRLPTTGRPNSIGLRG